MESAGYPPGAAKVRCPQRDEACQEGQHTASNASLDHVPCLHVEEEFPKGRKAVGGSETLIRQVAIETASARPAVASVGQGGVPFSIRQVEKRSLPPVAANAVLIEAHENHGRILELMKLCERRRQFPILFHISRDGTVEE
jgi:hypothetical protein